MAVPKRHLLTLHPENDAAITLTSSWQQIGIPFESYTFDSVALFVKLGSLGGTSDIKIRCRGQLSDDLTDPIKLPLLDKSGASVVLTEVDYTLDGVVEADHYAAVPVELDGLFPYSYIEMQAGTGSPEVLELYALFDRKGKDQWR